MIQLVLLSPIGTKPGAASGFARYLQRMGALVERLDLGQLTAAANRINAGAVGILLQEDTTPLGKHDIAEARRRIPGLLEVDFTLVTEGDNAPYYRYNEPGVSGVVDLLSSRPDDFRYETAV